MERESMKCDEVIKKGFIVKFLLLLVGVFIIFTVLSAAYSYIHIQRPLGTHYSAIITIISGIEETLVEETIKINLFFFLLIFAGIMILGILYTHRIVGPLQSVRNSAKLVSLGKLNTEMTFRKNDAIHPLKDSFNIMTTNYRDRAEMLLKEIELLKESMTKLNSLSEEGNDTESEMKKVLDRDRRIKNILSEIKI